MHIVVRLPYHINSISSVVPSIVFDSQRPGSIHHVSVYEVDIEGEGANIYLANLKTSIVTIMLRSAV